MLMFVIVIIVGVAAAVSFVAALEIYLDNDLYLYIFEKEVDLLEAKLDKREKYINDVYKKIDQAAANRRRTR